MATRIKAKKAKSKTRKPVKAKSGTRWTNRRLGRGAIGRCNLR
jgi:hypothetical protein